LTYINIGLDLNKNHCWLKKFYEAHTILDKGYFLPAVREKPFLKDYNFRKFFIKLLAAFLCTAPWCPPQHHLFTKAMAIVITQFRKAANILYKNMLIYQRLSETFIWLRNRFPK
jgi:hypothetical protein